MEFSAAMRGSKFLKEPPAPSICAFCAHRLGARRRPSHVQRRFLQSSQSSLKPPAEAAAVRNDDDEEAIQPRSSQPVTSSWANKEPGRGNGPAATSAFGSSTIASKGPVGGWGMSSSIPPKGPVGGFGMASSIPSRAPQASKPGSAQDPMSAQQSLTQLLPHEQRAKELIMEREKWAQSRQVNIHAGPGPESNRAGKPVPYNQEAILQLAQEDAKRKEAMDRHMLRKEATQNRPLIRRTNRPGSHVIETSGEQNLEAENEASSLEAVSRWNQLRRRGSEPPKPPAPVDSFTEARAKREEQTRSGGYTPLGNRNVAEAGAYEQRPRADMWSRYSSTNRIGNEPGRANQASEGSTPFVGKGTTQAFTGSTPVVRKGPGFGAQSPISRAPVTATQMGGFGAQIPTSRAPVTATQKGGFGAQTPPPRGLIPPTQMGGFGTQIPRPRAPVPPTQIPRFGAQIPTSRAPVGATQIPGSMMQDGQVPDRPRHMWPGAFKDGTIMGQVDQDIYKAPQNGAPPSEARSILSPQTEEFLRQIDEEPRNEKEEEEDGDEDEETATPRRKLSDRFVGEAGYTSKGAQRPPMAKDKSQRRRHYNLEDDDDDKIARALERAEIKKWRKQEKAAKKAAAPTPILLPEYISVSNLAVALKVKLDTFVEKMEDLGFEETNHDYILNAENAGLIAMEYNFEPIIDRAESEDLKARDPPEDPSVLPPRSPVVTIMGHVDHGKTTILDYLRKSSVAASEHGGITQHIGAFSVPMPSGKTITFLDTPGHEAFLSMRQRGANVTDIVILVVAADDSVKPQTIEAINHAKAAKVPIIVAINKVDKPEIDIDGVKHDLARNGVEIEDYGGDTQVVCVSGLTGQGMDQLEEAAVTLSEILDMRAERDGPAEGWVIEASIKSMGKVATVLVRRGTMRPGDVIVAGKTWARIRCLRNEAGVEIEEAGPGTPVQIDGWRDQPLAGDEVLQAPHEAKAKSVVEYRIEKEERDKMAQDMEAINEFRKLENEKRAKREEEDATEDATTTPTRQEPAAPSGPKLVYFIVKADVSGSVEAVVDSISQIGTKEVEPIILRSGVGQINESDIEHAASAKGYIINFNTDVEPKISRAAAESKVKILDHNIIYRLVDDVRAELSTFLPPLITTRVLGEAEVSTIFSINVKGRKYKSVAGCKVRNGTVSKMAKYRVLRNGEKVFDGTLESLKHVKKDVMEMKNGTECGMAFEGWSDFQVGDKIQAYEEIHQKRYL